MTRLRRFLVALRLWRRGQLDPALMDEFARRYTPVHRVIDMRSGLSYPPRTASVIPIFYI